MPRRAVVFFVDRSVGKHAVAQALRDRGANVELHDDHFARDVQDVDWIMEVGRRGWAIITKDRRIRYCPLERMAIAAAEARVFSLTKGNLSGPEMAAIFVKHLERMERISVGEQPPFVARVTRSGIIVEHLRR